MKSLSKLALCLLLAMSLTVSAFAAQVPDSLVAENLNGQQRLVKTYTLSPEVDPDELKEEDFSYDGYLYTWAYTTKVEHPYLESKTVTETVTVNTAKNDLAQILAELSPSMPYEKDGFSGELALDHTTLSTEASGYTTKYSKTTETKVIGNLDYSDAFEKVVIGDPLLTTDEDFQTVADAIVDWTKDYDDGETAIVFMGHGTEAESNAVYQKMQDLLTSGGHTNYFVGTVEAAPSLDDVIAAVKAGEYKKVVLEPLMVVAGDHANNDMAGDEDDSWKSAFEKEGYEVTCLLRGLGENETIRQLYVAHAQAAVNAIAQ